MHLVDDFSVNLILNVFGLFAIVVLLIIVLMLVTYPLRKGKTPAESINNNSIWGPVILAMALGVTVLVVLSMFGKIHWPDRISNPLHKSEVSTSLTTVDSLRQEADELLVWADSLHTAIERRTYERRTYSDAADMSKVDSLRTVAKEMFAKADSLEVAAKKANKFPWTWMSLILVAALAAFAFVKTWIGRVVTTLVTYGVIILMNWRFSHPAQAIYVWQMLTAVVGLALMYLAAKPRNWLFDLDLKTGDPGPAKLHWPSLIGCWVFFVGAMLAWQNWFGWILMVIGWFIGGALSVPLLQVMIPTIFGKPIYTVSAKEDEVEAIMSGNEDKDLSDDDQKLTEDRKNLSWLTLLRWGMFTRNLGIGDRRGMLWFCNGLGFLLIPLWLPFMGIITLVQNRVEMTDSTEEVPTLGSAILGSMNQDTVAPDGTKNPSLTVAPLKLKLWMVIFANDDPETVLKLSPPDRAQVKKMSISGASGWWADTAIGTTFEEAMVAPFFQGNREESDLQDVAKLVRRNVGHLVTQVKVLDRNPPEAVQKALAAITETAAKKVQAKLQVEIDGLAGDAISERINRAAVGLGLTQAETWALIIQEERAKNATSQFVVSEGVLPSIGRLLTSP